MVRNEKGGKGAKGLARKTQSSASSDKLRLSTCEFEQYACVTKIFGNAMCEIFTNDNVKLLCHIRNKFRGRQKRNNFISTHSIILVGLREWETPYKNCDLLFIYDDSHIEQLKHFPHVHIHHLLTLIQPEFSTHLQDNLLFSNDISLPLDSSFSLPSFSLPSLPNHYHNILIDDI
jgi:translation initiation factor IF-1